MIHGHEVETDESSETQSGVVAPQLVLLHQELDKLVEDKCAAGRGGTVVMVIVVLTVLVVVGFVVVVVVAGGTCAVVCHDVDIRICSVL